MISINKLYVSPNNLFPSQAIIDDKDEVKHVIANRMKIGQKIEIGDGNGNDYIAKILSIDDSKIVFEILEKIIRKPEKGLILYQTILKGDNMDLIIQKASELGIERVVPMLTQNTIVSFKSDKDISKKVERWTRLSYESAKQCKRSFVMEIDNPVIMKNLFFGKHNNLILLPEKSNIELDSIELIKTIDTLIFVGPEGGFTSDEVEFLVKKGATSVKLGNLIMKSETASIVSMSLFNYLLGKL